MSKDPIRTLPPAVRLIGRVAAAASAVLFAVACYLFFSDAKEPLPRGALSELGPARAAAKPAAEPARPQSHATTAAPDGARRRPTTREKQRIIDEARALDRACGDRQADEVRKLEQFCVQEGVSAAACRGRFVDLRTQYARLGSMLMPRCSRAFGTSVQQDFDEVRRELEGDVGADARPRRSSPADPGSYTGDGDIGDGETGDADDDQGRRRQFRMVAPSL